MRVRWILPLLFAMSACLQTVTPPEGFSGTGPRVLFVGNSHTYVNDVPGLLQALADSSGAGPIAVGSIAKPNFALIDHWNDPATRDQVAACSGMRHLVLQQGWTPGGVYRDTLRLAVEHFGSLVAKCNTRIVLLQTWPPVDRPQSFQATIESHAEVARMTGASLAPVAAAWRLIQTRDATVQLYSPDGLHASPTGSYLIALALHVGMFDTPLTALPSGVRTHRGSTLTLDHATVQLLKSALEEAATQRGSP